MDSGYAVVGFNVLVSTSWSDILLRSQRVSGWWREVNSTQWIAAFTKKRIEFQKNYFGFFRNFHKSKPNKKHYNYNSRNLFVFSAFPFHQSVFEFLKLCCHHFSPYFYFLFSSKLFTFSSCSHLFFPPKINRSNDRIFLYSIFNEQ